MKYTKKELTFKTVTNVQKILILLLSVILGILIYNNTINSEVLSKDCSSDISQECVNIAIANFDYLSTLKPEQYFIFSQLLGQAGYYQKASEILLHSDSSITYMEFFDIAARQIAEQALKEPNEVASFEPIEQLKNHSTPIGRFIQKKFPDSSSAINAINTFAYSNLAFMLVGGTSEGGDANYVQYNKKMSVSKFKPNKTWDYLIEFLVNYALSQPEPARSNQLLSIASVLEYAAQKKQAYQIIKLVKATNQNSVQLVALLEKLDEYQDAKVIRKEFLPEFRNAIIDAKIAKEEGDFQKAKILLLEAFEDLANEDVKKINGRGLSGKDKGVALRACSKSF